ncbi:MAG: putative domain HDIG-containing protein [Anaerocolumna sp.]|jgi:putative nucleotidyltransferase with HDIG domain|nr:putative domain HDIG-containing protein [Anaerocolumna sp.]
MENAHLGTTTLDRNNKYVNEEGYTDKVDFFHNIDKHIMEDVNPSKYLNEIYKYNLFKERPFTMLYRLKEAMQSPIHHPEGNAWNHTMLVLDNAAEVRDKSKNPRVFMWAALLHDIGKPDTTRNRKGKITSYDHDSVGAILTKEFLEYFSCQEEFIESVVYLVRYHMHILYVLKDLPFGDIEGMKKNVDLDELALLGLCDRLGRLNLDREKEEDDIRHFLRKINKKKG